MANQQEENRKGEKQIPNPQLATCSSEVDSPEETIPFKHPRLTYCQLILKAILRTELKQITLAELYQDILDNYPYYRYKSKFVWQRSIRYNLTMQKYFERQAIIGKATSWILNPLHFAESVVKLHCQPYTRIADVMSSPAVVTVSQIRKASSSDANSVTNYHADLLLHFAKHAEFRPGPLNQASGCLKVLASSSETFVTIVIDDD